MIKAHYVALISEAWGVGHQKIKALIILVRHNYGKLMAHQVTCHIMAIFPPVIARGECQINRIQP